MADILTVDKFAARFNDWAVKEKKKSSLSKRTSKKVDEREDEPIARDGLFPEGDFGAVSPEQAFIQLLFTGFVKDQFYLSADKILDISLKLHRYYQRQYPDTYVKLIRYAREKTGIKDQLLIAAYFANDATLLDTLPPQQVLKYFTWHKKFKFPVGARVKKLVKEYLINRETDGDKINFAKVAEDLTQHRRAVRKLIMLAHLNMLPEYFSMFMNIQAPLPIEIREYVNDSTNVMFYNTMSVVDAGHFIPFEVMRSHVPKSGWDFTKVKMSPYMALSMVKSIAESSDDKTAASFLREGKYLSTDKLFTAFVAIPEEYSEIRSTIAQLYVNRIKTQYKELLLFDEEMPIVAVLDISGSMRDNFVKMLGMITPFAPLLEKMYLFSDGIELYSPEKLFAPEGIMETLDHIKETSGGTNLMGALHSLARLKAPRTIIIVTDEQGTYDSADSTYGEAVQHLLDQGHKLIIINPASYQPHTIAQKEGVIYLPAINAESLAGAMRLLELEKHKYTFDVS
ncbi:MAG: VWA domain-containing protein [Candidatus Parvarchaeum sp.]